MLELISIHIPKTAGTTFHAILEQVYGMDAVSLSYRRRDVLKHLVDGNFRPPLPYGLRVLHGHFYFKEVLQLQEQSGAKMICWFRNPVERVISNYRFFIAGLKHPDRNPQQYELNKHRKGESLLTYAARSENQNRMHAFTAGLEPEELFFCGLMEHFEQDVHQLAAMLKWPSFSIPRLNQGTVLGSEMDEVSSAVKQQIKDWNALDIALYNRILQLRGLSN